MAARPRHILVTGGSRGIGLAIAQLFAKNAYRCTLISRSEQDLKAAVSSLQPLPTQLSSSTSEHASHQYQHGYIAGSISQGTQFWSSDPSSPFGALLPKPSRQKTPTHPSRIDVVVNCAGITQTKLFSTLDESAMENIISTNLTALMQGTKFLLRNGYLRGSSSSSSSSSSKEGKEDFNPTIINVASLLGLHGGYGAVAYAASKAGVLGFTRALATEYASHKVRVNAIVPGYVETDMTKGKLRSSC